MAAVKSDQHRDLETSRKIAAALEWLQLAADRRRGTGCFGRMQIEIIWDNGYVKRLRLMDETSMEDLTPAMAALIGAKKSQGGIDGSAPAT